MDCPYCGKKINPYYSFFYRGLHYCLDCINKKKKEDEEILQLPEDERKKLYWNKQREWKNRKK